MKEIKCIIFDWAGTTVDYGCFAPVAAFMESFEKIGVPVTAAETRQYMGLTKIEEIRALFSLDRVNLTPFMSAYSKALQRMIDEGRLSVSGAIQSSFGGQVFGRM